MPRKTTDCLSPVDIKNYLDNKLPAIEEYDIEQHLVDCPLCSAAIAGYSEHQNYEDLLTEISKLRPTDAIATNKIVALASENRPWIWWSAAALFICIPFSYYFYYQQTHTYSRFAAAYSELMPAPHALVRGENLATKTATDKAFLRYEQGDYETSLTAFEAVLKTNPQNTETALYAGLSAMGKKDWETAKNYLEKVHLAGDSTNRDDAVWYLAIVALQQNNPQRASCFLHELVETPNSWQQKASAMLEELNK